MWQAIDGDVEEISLPSLIRLLPAVGMFYWEGVYLVVIDYALWKEKMLTFFRDKGVTQND